MLTLWLLSTARLLALRQPGSSMEIELKGVTALTIFLVSHELSFHSWNITLTTIVSLDKNGTQIQCLAAGVNNQKERGYLYIIVAGKQIKSAHNYGIL